MTYGNCSKSVYLTLFLTTKRIKTDSRFDYLTVLKTTKAPVANFDQNYTTYYITTTGSLFYEPLISWIISHGSDYDATADYVLQPMCRFRSVGIV